MPSAGIQVAPECVEKFNELKLGKQLKYIIYKIEQTQVVIDEYGSEQDYEVFRQKLINKDDPTAKGKKRPSYAVYDLQYELEDGGPRSKIIFISYSNDETTSIKARMVYASSREGLKSSLSGIALELQANGEDEVEYQDLAKLAAGRSQLKK